MLHAIILEAKSRQYITLFLFLFLLFLGLYVFLDFEGNTNYQLMIDQYGVGITSVHILINVIIAILTSIMVGFSIINFKLTNTEPIGSNAIPFLTFIFGILTFGCTSCVVAFFAAIGIAFSPIVLPNGNLLWKLAALGIVVLGFLWILYSLEHSTCKIKK